MFDTAWSTSFVTGFTLGASLIVAIGAQNAFVLRQGLRREHVGPVVAVCSLLDIVLMAVGVVGLGAVGGVHPGWLEGAALAGAAVLALYALSAFWRALKPQALSADAQGGAKPLGHVLAQVLGFSVLNPHVYLDTVVLVGSVGARQATGTQWAFLAGSSLASVLWFATLGYGARALSPLFARPVAWRVLDLLIGLTMAAIAWQLATGAMAG